MSNSTNVESFPRSAVVPSEAHGVSRTTAAIHHGEEFRVSDPWAAYPEYVAVLKAELQGSFSRDVFGVFDRRNLLTKSK